MLGRTGMENVGVAVIVIAMVTVGMVVDVASGVGRGDVGAGRGV